MTAVHRGHCLCGAVRFEAEGPPKWAAYCHCQSCRRASGAPVAAWAGFESANVKWPGAKPAVYESSPGVKRGYCGRCHSPVFYQGEHWAGETHLPLGIFDEPGRITPAKEVFAEERIPWMHLKI
jgi:hypothetical protein